MVKILFVCLFGPFSCGKEEKPNKLPDNLGTIPGNFCFYVFCYSVFFCQNTRDGPSGLRTPRLATEPWDGPTQNFHEKYRKNTPQPEILDSQNITPKYPENTEKIPPKYQKCVFLVFFQYFGVFCWGSRISAWGVIFRYFSWKFRVGPSL